MAVKKTREQAVTAYRLINPAKLTKMETSERYALILATRQLKKVSEDFDGLLKDAQEKLKPEGFDKIVEKTQSQTELAAQEQTALNEYQRQVSDCVSTELKKEAELDFEPLSKEAVEHFIESNDFSVEQIIAIEDVIGG